MIVCDRSNDVYVWILCHSGHTQTGDQRHIQSGGACGGCILWYMICHIYCRNDKCWKCDCSFVDGPIFFDRFGMVEHYFVYEFWKLGDSYNECYWRNLKINIRLVKVISFDKWINEKGQSKGIMCKYTRTNE